MQPLAAFKICMHNFWASFTSGDFVGTIIGTYLLLRSAVQNAEGAGYIRPDIAGAVPMEKDH